MSSEDEVDESKLTSSQLDAFLDEASDALGPDGDTVSQAQTSKDQSEPSEPTPADRVELIPGYVILDVIGKGGMGVVYKAQQKNLRREVAIKTLLMSLLSNQNAAARFEREAMIVAQLRHPNIVTAIDYGRAEGQLYLVMELLVGQTIADLLATQHTFDEPTAWGIARQTVSALAHAAEFGVVHRDIKPANLFLVEPPLGVDLAGCSKLVKVTDFGIASVEQTDLDEERLTANHAVLGTPRYMAPEQCYGGDVTLHADMYSLGATVYHMLAGYAPFGNRFGPKEFTKFMMYRAAHRPDPIAESIDGISPESDALLLYLLSPDPEDRPADYKELLGLIDHLLGRSDSQFTTSLTNKPPGSTGTIQLTTPDDATQAKTGEQTLSNASNSTELDSKHSRKLLPKFPSWFTRTRLAITVGLILIFAFGAFWWIFVRPPVLEEVQLGAEPQITVLNTWDRAPEDSADRFFVDLRAQEILPVVDHQGRKVWKLDDGDEAIWGEFSPPWDEDVRLTMKVDLSDCKTLDLYFGVNTPPDKLPQFLKSYRNYPYYWLRIEPEASSSKFSLYAHRKSWTYAPVLISERREVKDLDELLGEDDQLEIEFVRYRGRWHFRFKNQAGKSKSMGQVRTTWRKVASQIIFRAQGGPVYFHSFRMENAGGPYNPPPPPRP